MRDLSAQAAPGGVALQRTEHAERAEEQAGLVTARRLGGELARDVPPSLRGSGLGALLFVSASERRALRVLHS